MDVATGDRRRMAAVILTGLALAACGERPSADAKICSPLPAKTASDPAAVEPQGGDAAAVEDCLHRWGYRLARTKLDSADVVAGAVVAVCSPVLSRWNQASLNAVQPGAPDAAVSLVTGETLNTPADRFRMAQSRALFFVVQARAGNCAAP